MATATTRAFWASCRCSPFSKKYSRYVVPSAFPTFTAIRPPNAHAKSGYSRGETHIPSASSRNDTGTPVRATTVSRYRSTKGTEQTTVAIASTTYPLAFPVITSDSRMTPMSRPAACGPKIAPEMMPRWVSGTWSATAANSPAEAMENPSEANIQHTMTPSRDRCVPVASSDTASTTTPAAIHTRRRPNRDRVWSHSAPATGSAISATTPAAALVMPKSRTLCAASNDANWFGSTSCTGTSHAIQNPNQSKVNRLVQPTDTRVVGSCVDVVAADMIGMYRLKSIISITSCGSRPSYLLLTRTVRCASITEGNMKAIRVIAGSG